MKRQPPHRGNPQHNPSNPTQPTPPNRRPSFTLLELLVVVALIGIFLAVGTYTWIGTDNNPAQFKLTNELVLRQFTLAQDTAISHRTHTRVLILKDLAPIDTGQIISQAGTTAPTGRLLQIQKYDHRAEERVPIGEALTLPENIVIDEEHLKNSGTDDPTTTLWPEADSPFARTHPRAEWYVYEFDASGEPMDTKTTSGGFGFEIRVAYYKDRVPRRTFEIISTRGFSEIREVSYLQFDYLSEIDATPHILHVRGPGFDIFWRDDDGDLYTLCGEPHYIRYSHADISKGLNYIIDAMTQRNDGVIYVAPIRADHAFVWSDHDHISGYPSAGVRWWNNYSERLVTISRPSNYVSTFDKVEHSGTGPPPYYLVEGITVQTFPAKLGDAFLADFSVSPDYASLAKIEFRMDYARGSAFLPNTRFDVTFTYSEEGEATTEIVRLPYILLPLKNPTNPNTSYGFLLKRNGTLYRFKTPAERLQLLHRIDPTHHPAPLNPDPLDPDDPQP